MQDNCPENYKKTHIISITIINKLAGRRIERLHLRLRLMKEFNFCRCMLGVFKLTLLRIISG